MFFNKKVYDNTTLIDKIDMKRLPKHIAIIMDGNGRWAKKEDSRELWDIGQQLKI